MLLEWLKAEYAALFTIIALGLLAGRLKFRGLSLESSAVIFVALLFGMWGVSISPVFRQVGLVLFIFTVGMQAAPGFIEAFRGQALRLVAVAAFTIVSAAVVAWLAGWWLGLDSSLTVGLFTGALTSTPGLAAAIESSGSPLASIGYGISYPFGVLGVVLFIKLAPVLFRMDMPQAERDYQAENQERNPQITNRNFLVKNSNISGQPLWSLNVREMTGAVISRIMRGEEVMVPVKDTVLKEGDVVKAVGTEEALARTSLLIGPPTAKEIPASKKFEVQWMLVTQTAVVGKTLRELNLTSNYQATVTRIRRSGIDITPQPDSKLMFGDKLMVACPAEQVKEIGKLLGNSLKQFNETDFLPIAAGIVAGALLGHVSIPITETFHFSPGLTGGVLIAALILGRLGKTGPIVWTLSGPGNHLVRQLGLLLFLASVGTDAGAHLPETLAQYGWGLFLTGAVITLLPMVMAVLMARWVLNMNALPLFGALAGGMTSTPGLSAATGLTESNAPQIAYATVYPFALVLLILVAQLVVKI